MGEGTKLKVLKCLQGTELLEMVSEVSRPLSPLRHLLAFRLAHARSQTGTHSPDVPSGTQISGRTETTSAMCLHQEGEHPFWEPGRDVSTCLLARVWPRACS